MVAHKLSQKYKQCPCSIPPLFVVSYETNYDQHNLLLVLQTFHYCPIYFNNVIMIILGHPQKIVLYINLMM